MTDDERDELIEKSLLKELDASDEARVQQLRRDDTQFRQEYDFQEMLIQQVRLKRKQELLGMFAQFDAEQAAETDVTPIIPLQIQSDQETTTTDPQVIPLWRQSWFRVAASVLLVAIIGAVIWRQLSKYDPKPIADDHRDSTKTQPLKDTLRNKPIVPPVIPLPTPQGPVAHEPVQPTKLQGTMRLPYYETDNVRLGFGESQKTNEYRTAVFSVGPEPAYEFQDTLRVYLPRLPAAKPAWSLVYDRASDTYYLVSGKNRYEVVKGLPGKQPLTNIK